MFLIFSPDVSLLMYRNANDFCMLILSPATLLNSFINSNGFYLGGVLGFSTYSIMSSAETILILPL